jgi:hypothetical protein
LSSKAEGGIRNLETPGLRIALCLDHRSDEEGSNATDEHYVQSQHIHEKLQVLTAWEKVLSDIIAGN